MSDNVSLHGILLSLIQAFGGNQPTPTGVTLSELLNELTAAIQTSPNPGGPFYNMEPANFPNTRKAVANVRAGSASSYVLHIGTSITAGNPALTTPATQAVPAVLSTLVNTYLCTSQLTLIACQPSLVSNSDSRFNFSGATMPTNWTAPGTGAFGFADVAYFKASGSGGANLTYTPANGQVDTFSCICGQNNLTGTLAQSFNASAGAGFNTHIASGSSCARQGTALTGTRGTSNTLTLSTGSGNAAFVLAIDAYDSTVSELRFGNAGVPLLGTTGAWATAGGGQSIPTVEVVAPALSIIELGADDAPLAVSAATYQANLTTLITACQTTGDVLLWTTPQNNNTTTNSFDSQYSAVQFQVAQSMGCGLVDIGSRFGTYATWNGQGFAADGTHPNALGCADIAGALFNALSFVV